MTAGQRSMPTSNARAAASASASAASRSSRACQAPSALSASPISSASSAASAHVERLPAGLGSMTARRSRAFSRRALSAERAVELLQAAQALEPQLGRAGLATDRVFIERGRPVGMSELPVLDAGRAHQQLGAPLAGLARRRRRRQPRARRAGSRAASASCRSRSSMVGSSGASAMSATY